MPAVKDPSSPEVSPLKGPAPVAQPEDTSEIDKNEDIMPLTSPGDQPVQFVSGQPINGDAKVEIGDASGPPAFVGLGKEELMKYANDPFWVRLRWFLFILFWALWVAMLVGAIVIIVLAPKCAEKKSQPENFYQMNLKNFAKDGKLADLGKRADYLAELGVTSVILSDVLKKDEMGGTLDFKNVQEDVGTLAEFTDAMKKLKKAGLRVLMTLVPNHSSKDHEWFTHADAEYQDYYVRKLSSEVFGSSWRSINARTVNAWASDPTVKEHSYLQLFNGTADLNFRNKRVVAEMTGVFSYWKSKGVDAFVIPAASYMVEDLENLKSQDAVINQPENIEVIKTILNRQNNEHYSFIEANNLNENDKKEYLANGIVPLSEAFDYSVKVDQYARTENKMEFFKSVHKTNNAVIRMSSSQDRLINQNVDEANIARLLAYTSNASVILHYGDEVEGFDTKSNMMNWDTVATNGSTFTFLKTLAEIQSSLEDEGKGSFTYPYKGANRDVFAIVRSNKYVIIVNYGTSSVTVDFSELLDNPEAEADVIIATPNAADALKPKTVLTKTVELPRRSGVLLEKKQAAE